MAAWLALLGATAQAQQSNNLVYQVFVRSFASSEGAAGDLRGLRQQLDYIESLHAGILWLMPVFPSKTYHGYDITDYRSINPEYGTLDDFDSLVKEAHKRGIRVILDIAFNHTSVSHPWFQQAVHDTASPYRSYYRISEDDSSPLPRRWHRIGKVRYFGEFSRNMPDLDFDSPEVRREVKAIAKFWLDRGVDGFRLDAAKHVYEEDVSRTNEWWREFSDHVHAINPRALLIGEVLGSSEAVRSHAGGLKAMLNDALMRMLREQAISPRAGFLRRWIESTKGFEPFAFLASHDENARLASFLEQAKLPEAYGLAMVLLLALARNPVLYNGDEIMQRGIKWDGTADRSRIYDETLREPFPWFQSAVKLPQTTWFKPRYDGPNDGVSVQEQEKRGSMLSLVRALTKLRVEHPAFANGEITEIVEDSAERLVFRKGGYLAVIKQNRNAAADFSVSRSHKLVFRTEGFALFKTM